MWMKNYPSILLHNSIGLPLNNHILKIFYLFFSVQLLRIENSSVLLLVRNMCLNKLNYIHVNIFYGFTLMHQTVKNCWWEGSTWTHKMKKQNISSISLVETFRSHSKLKHSDLKNWLGGETEGLGWGKCGGGGGFTVKLEPNG